MSKFKIGDITIDTDDTFETASRYRIIQNIKDEKYYYKLHIIGEGVTDNYLHSFDIEDYDNTEKHHHKKIKATKIARKLNKGNIIKEEDGWLTIRM